MGDLLDQEELQVATAVVMGDVLCEMDRAREMWSFEDDAEASLEVWVTGLSIYLGKLAYGKGIDEHEENLKKLAVVAIAALTVIHLNGKFKTRREDLPV